MELETWNFAQSNFKTIQFDTSDETDLNDIKVPLKKLLFFWWISTNNPKLVPNFDRKLIILFEKVEIKTLLTDGGLNYPWEAILIS